jgi:hypothetical protein
MHSSTCILGYNFIYDFDSGLGGWGAYVHYSSSFAPAKEDFSESLEFSILGILVFFLRSLGVNTADGSL